ncbi:Verru_Chthon cassette protein A [Terrimicrobium sacchariphilum]|uniref:Verru_Chthon cassette protein A n=1 Tax=Terrimicrobium sacchariphilum TaxID=690879 RepID=A0A146G7R7_TERSA|nr:Verru_Chthon cassette protein A [Terrimicrobium sacchariphilum]GAT33590.1 Verru_Chthon cassette protein A [Terrimicrobium sacchariphilum]
MNCPLWSPAGSPSGNNRGASLVLVLIGITLISILLLAFLATVRTEVQSSKVYASGASLKLLANNAVNLVEGQIRVATGNPSLNWASQPGMIRTYATSGQPSGYYKLYSDSGMQGPGKFDHTTSTNGVPANWYSQRGIYTDLNQPVRIGSTNYYPILVGDASDLASYNSPLAANAKAYAPITSGTPSVEGFWLNNAPVDPKSPNQAPMPVKWLYVLQDGKIITPSSSANGVVSFNSSGAQPSATNQIVGRIAFWTDDETTKININTASEGTFWDTPRTYTTQDFYLATRQPVQGEFQRYPGHPATICLSTVMGLGITSTGWTPSNPASHLGLEDLYPITPATKPGGSKGGNTDTSPTSNTLPASVTRLYSTVDEFLFQTALDASGARKENGTLLASPTALDPATLRRASFFLTASSQAPDVNIYNLPRVSMWPITLNSSGTRAMTPFDKLIAFCTTVNNHIFHFQRQDANSPTVDLPAGGSQTGLGRNRQLLEYLRALTALPAPGFSTGSFAGKYGDDRNQILTEIFDYIRSTNLQDSTTGATPYARALFSNATDGEPGKGQVIPIVDMATTVSDAATGKPSHPRGFGRFPTIQQAFLVFIGAGNNSPAFNPAVSGYPGFTGFTFPAITANGTQRVQAGFFLQMYDPTSGTPFTYPWYEIQVEGLDTLAWSNDNSTSHAMTFPSSGVIRPNGAVGLSMSLYGGITDYRIFTYGKNKASAANRYPFITRPTGAQSGAPPALVGCPDMNNGQIYFKGGSTVAKIFALDASGNRISTDPIQTVNLNFPAATLPVPDTVADSATALNSNATSYNFRSFYDNGSSPFGRLNFNKNISWISSRDVVRALVATPGDARLLAARAEVPSSMLQPLTSAMTSADYMSSTQRHSHMLRFGLAYPVYGASGGKLVNVNYSNYQPKFEVSAGRNINDTDFYGGPGNATYYRSKDTSVPSLTGATTSSGVPADWDNGIANNVDGPLINKPDEGDAGRNDVNGRPYFELDYGAALAGDTFFSPNRMIPSPGMLGSLPTGVLANKPWQTLLFRPGPANHPGLGSATMPPDHLILDLFTMPVVEPYAISTPLATAGRINMNHLIVPFTYINRDTGLRAAMKSQMVTVIPSPGTGLYKTYQNPNGSPSSGNKPSNIDVRFPVDADKTLSQFASRFATGDIFRSASEICSIDLVPAHNSAPALPITRANMDAFWNSYPVTGDNVRERPYTNLYSLLTTKSNTYTVHYRVQSLKQTPGSDYSTWREDRDTVLGQLRGSQTIERYIDPGDSIPDYATVISSSSFPPSQPLGDYYRFRVIANHQFAP